MEDINDIYAAFIVNFKTVLLFISEHFGDRDILIRKNKGLIPDRNVEIKNSEIKAYFFHGFGCMFRFKNDITIDVEFNDNNIGFTGWAFYVYVKRIESEVKQIEIEQYLQERIERKCLSFYGKIYTLIE